MKKLVPLLFFAFSFFALTSCKCTGSSNYIEDEQYWNSIQREQQFKDEGLDGAANIERKNRQKYMRGEGYTSPDGGQQIHYKGSVEQQRDLDAIDEYMRTHPDF